MVRKACCVIFGLLINDCVHFLFGNYLFRACVYVPCSALLKDDVTKRELRRFLLSFPLVSSKCDKFCFFHACVHVRRVPCKLR